MRKFLSAAVAAFSLCALLPAGAAAADRTISVRIPHGDLDLSRPDHVETLRKRIASASNRACRSHNPLFSPTGYIDEACVAQVKAAALAVMERRVPTQVAAKD